MTVPPSSSTNANAGTSADHSVNTLPVIVPDTFLDTHGLSKGIAFLNRQPLGRFWSIGPEFTLYTPGPWLHTGANEIVLFDLQGTKTESFKTTDHADYGPAPK